MGILDFFTSKNKREKKTLITNMLLIAAADGQVDGSEINVIRVMAATVGVAESEIDAVIKNPGSFKMAWPDNDNKREAHLNAYIYVLLADGVINDDEYALCIKLGKHLGFSENAVEKAIDHTITRLKKRVAKGEQLEKEDSIELNEGYIINIVRGDFINKFKEEVFSGFIIYTTTIKGNYRTRIGDNWIACLNDLEYNIIEDHPPYIDWIDTREPIIKRFNTIEEAIEFVKKLKRIPFQEGVDLGFIQPKLYDIMVEGQSFFNKDDGSVFTCELLHLSDPTGSDCWTIDGEEYSWIVCKDDNFEYFIIEDYPKYYISEFTNGSGPIKSGISAKEVLRFTDNLKVISFKKAVELGYIDEPYLY